MKWTLRTFFLLIFAFILGLFFLLFHSYYEKQQDHTATIIMNELKSNLARFSFVLSKYMRQESILTSRSLLDSEVAYNRLISAVAVFDGDRLLLSSDPSYKKMLTTQELYHDKNERLFNHLQHNTGLIEKLRYYDGAQKKFYTLIYYVDRDVIKASFSDFKADFIMAFVLIPLVMMIMLALIIRYYVILPLERLRQYAYYQSDVPEEFLLKELEYIRASMIQTFTRLETERKELYTLSHTDSLSGLANREFLFERTTQIIQESKRHKQEFAVLFLDLDHFKSVNDSLGHDIGDELIKNIAASISELLRVNDVVARIGGDEFVIVLTHYQDEMELIEILHRIQKRIEKMWLIQTHPIYISCSIGVTFYPKDGKNLLDLMKNADIAMYEAKNKGRKQYHFYTKELNTKTQDYITLSNDMRDALASNEYELFYQPQNSVENGSIVGTEALLRWNHPTKGMIPPSIFIPIAEQNGFIVDLGKWILKTAFIQKSLWEEQNISLKLSINVAAKQILQEGFVEHLEILLETYAVNTSEISLEMTEYIFLEQNDNILNIFKQIKALGFEISLDDFGTGYSSLSYLKSFPIDTLKIDKSFIDDCDSEDGQVFVETIVKMAEILKLHVVAEGVEDEAQLSYLKTIGCETYQGYVCSKPVAIDAFNTLYKSLKD